MKTTMIRAICVGLLFSLQLDVALAGAAIIVEQPATNMRIAEGPNYASEVIGDRWDMNELTDVNVADSSQLSNLSVSGGVYSATTTGNDPRLWMVYPGLPNAVRLNRGERFPINPDRYYLLSVKVRIDDPGGTVHSALVYGYENAQSVNPPDTYVSNPIRVLQPEWRIFTFDLRGEGNSSDGAWQSTALRRGVRFDPTTRSGFRINIDWMRLHGESDETSVPVVWSGEFGVLKDIIAVDDQDVAAIIQRDVSSPYQADLSRLPPGDYRLGVGDLASPVLERVDLSNFVLSPGVVTINAAPIVRLTEPDLRGDQANSYADVELGNTWAVMDSADVEVALDLTDVSYAGGVLQGRPTSSDSRVLLNTPNGIDAETYRMLCFELDIAGPRDVGEGSVARILWGDDRTDLVTSEDVVIDEGLNEYCLGDMTQVETEATAPGNWAGSFRYLRFDPHEFPSTAPCPGAGTAEQCRDITLASVNLAPFDSARPDFQFSWTDLDPDDNASIDILLDSDRIPDNGNEVLIVSGLRENDALDSVLWDAAASTVADGVYEVLVRADDGLNAVDRYASGPLLVGPASVASDRLFSDGFE